MEKQTNDNLNRKVMVALDVESREKALDLAAQLQGSGCWLKVGMELYAYAGLSIVRELKELGFPVFLDLKLHDIPTTVEKTVSALVSGGADMLNIHCSGGYEMMARSAEAARRAGGSWGSSPKLIGVTVLTSMGQEQLQNELSITVPLREHVVALATMAQKAGLDGVVASAQEGPDLRRALGSDFLLVTPGIRPVWSAANDQARVLTPRQALAAGSSYLVVGRPITQSADPRAALARLWED